jgi:hypothetical protein
MLPGVKKLNYTILFLGAPTSMPKKIIMKLKPTQAISVTRENIKWKEIHPE